MELSPSVLSAIALSALALAVISLGMALALGRRLARRRGPRARHRLAQAAVPRDPEALAAEIAELREVFAHAVQRVGLVRFDAFEDMGGRLSFATALLDAEGSGIVLSSINGRTETRIYAKPVERGTSRHNLTQEEEEAIRRALGVTPVRA